MKKFLACVFILAIFSAFIFYLGWTQFKVKPDYVGIIVSKTSGIADKPVENGKLSWNWEFLLPTNAELKTINIVPVNINRTVKGQLPSGDVYTSVYNSSDAFSYFFDFSISLTVSPEAVVELYKLNKISNSEDLQEYLNNAASILAQLAADYYLKKASENSSFRPESVRRDDILKSVQFYKDCPEIDVTIFALNESKIPDYDLYKKLKNDFFINKENNFIFQNNVDEFKNEESQNDLQENSENDFDLIKNKETELENLF